MDPSTKAVLHAIFEEIIEVKVREWNGIDSKIQRNLCDVIDWRDWLIGGIDWLIHSLAPPDGLRLNRNYLLQQQRLM